MNLESRENNQHHISLSAGYVWGKGDFFKEIELPGEAERAVAGIHCVPGSGLGLGKYLIYCWEQTSATKCLQHRGDHIWNKNKGQQCVLWKPSVCLGHRDIF